MVLLALARRALFALPRDLAGPSRPVSFAPQCPLVAPSPDRLVTHRVLVRVGRFVGGHSGSGGLGGTPVVLVVRALRSLAHSLHLAGILAPGNSGRTIDGLRGLTADDPMACRAPGNGARFLSGRGAGDGRACARVASARAAGVHGLRTGGAAGGGRAVGVRVANGGACAVGRGDRALSSVDGGCRHALVPQI
jgi:hypothetical protein